MIFEDFPVRNQRKQMEEPEAEGQQGSSGPEDVHTRMLKWMTVTAEMCCSERP